MAEAEPEDKKDITAGVENLALQEPKEKTDTPAVDSTIKIDILLQPTGSAPIMKNKKWTVDQKRPIIALIKFVHKYLKLDPEVKLFLYVNQTFAPSPDQIIKNLYDCFGSNGKLVLYYSMSQAWG